MPANRGVLGSFLGKHRGNRKNEKEEKSNFFHTLLILMRIEYYKILFYFVNRKFSLTENKKNPDVKSGFFLKVVFLFY
tara:strand:- start:649 stop:882 length:234 start_codon:yes stop_codon:yes gene_type:complete